MGHRLQGRTVPCLLQDNLRAIAMRSWAMHWRRARLLPALQLLVALQLQAMLTGCSTSVQLTPLMSGDTPSDCRVLGHVSYDGNREYLPTVLVENASSPADSVLRYAHEARYGLVEVPP
jgi:hypothetical protein